MLDDSLLTKYQAFTSAACIAVHSNNIADGFRQSDFKFFIELFGNWCESSLGEFTLKIQNTQVMRYLDKLVSEGYARKIKKNKQPRYKLTRIGLIDLLMKLTTQPYYMRKEQFFFVIYFIKNYKERLEKLVKEEGSQFPSALRIELEALLDLKRLFAQEKDFIKREVKKLKMRIDDAEKTSIYVANKLRSSVPLNDILREVEKIYPYEFNSQKPLSELISQIPESQRIWELETGNVKRCREIWEPSIKQLENFYNLIDSYKIN
jgi:hypothetical protein